MALAACRGLTQGSARGDSISTAEDYGVNDRRRTGDASKTTDSRIRGKTITTGREEDEENREGKGRYVIHHCCNCLAVVMLLIIYVRSLKYQ